MHPAVFAKRFSIQQGVKTVSDFNVKERTPVSPFPVAVLGGSFSVNEIVVQPGKSEDDVKSFITGTPPERWFVLLAEDGDSTWDILSLIDDDFDFVMYAVGEFKGE